MEVRERSRTEMQQSLPMRVVVMTAVGADIRVVVALLEGWALAFRAIAPPCRGGAGRGNGRHAGRRGRANELQHTASRRTVL